jgi:hypothetical protein
MTFALTAWGLHASRPVHGQTLRGADRLTTTTVYPVPPTPLRRSTSGGAARLDLYGNEIEDAIGDYRQDAQGDTYERHSPQTAITRLAPAGT